MTEAMTSAPATGPRVVRPETVRAAVSDGDAGLLEVASRPDGDDERTPPVPGSRAAYWKDLLWDPLERRFPPAGVLRDRLAAMGLDPDAPLVVYGDRVQFGTYAYWALSSRGFRNIWLLDGAKAAWERPVDESATVAAPLHEPAPARTDPIIGRDEILSGLATSRHLLLDLRSPEEYRGERVSSDGGPGSIDHGAERKGRIPTAKHLYYADLLQDDDTFRPPAELADTVSAAGGDPSREMVLYCRLSHRASLGWFVMTELLGYPQVRVYDGSWTEWGSMVGMPIEG